MKRLAFLLILVVLAVVPSTAGGIPFFMENFEVGLAGSFTSTNFGTLAGQPSVFSRSNTSACGGTWTLVHTVTSGTDDPGSAVQHFGDAGDDGGGPNFSGTSGIHFRDVYVQWKMRYSAGFTWSVNYKNFILLSEDNRVHDGPNPWAGDYLTIYVAPGGHLRAEYNNKSATNGSQFIDIFPNLGQSDTIAANTCYTVEVRRRLNTVGSADGTFQMWLNHIKIAEYTNVRWRVAVSGALGTNDTYGSNALMVSDFATGANQNGTVRYDDIKIAETYIGPGTPYYVSPTGSNAAAGTLTAPWQTVTYATSSSSAATAGDTIAVRAGTYTGYVQLGKSGTTASPITLSGYPREDCGYANIETGCATTHAILTTGGANGNIYTGGANNWIIQGLEAKDSNGGSCLFMEDSSSSTSTMLIDRNWFHNCDNGDNASCITDSRWLGTITTTNNVMSDCNGSASHPSNNTGYVFFGAINTGTPGTVTRVLANNVIHDEAVGFKFKHPTASDQTVTIRINNNRLYTIAGKGAFSMATGTQASGKTVRVDHNIVYSSPGAPCVEVGDDFNDRSVEIDHNTCHNTENGLLLCLSDGCELASSLITQTLNVHDNIFMPKAQSGTVGYAYFIENTTNPFSPAADYNCLWNLTPTTTIGQWGGFGGGIDQTLAQWQVRGFDTHGSRVDPSFVSTGTADFHLNSGSGCKNLRGTGLDPGAYELGTETVGISGGSGGSSPATPAPTGPVRLRFVKSDLFFRIGAAV